MPDGPSRPASLTVRLSPALAALVAFVGPAAAHGGGLRDSAAGGDLSIPFWLFIATGGAVVTASFLLTTFATDRAFVRAVHDWQRSVAVPAGLRRGLAGLGRLAGVAVLVLVLVAALAGPTTDSAATVLVWVGWWAGFTASVYLVGNAWPAVNPWRTLAAAVPVAPRRRAPGAWASVAGLLALVFVEVVSPLADAPRLLAGVVLAYTAVTVAGAVLVGADAWFERVDPAARAFRLYGTVAPFSWRDGRLRLHLPGMRLPDGDLLSRTADVAFVLALLWVTTYDGLVGTPAGAALIRGVVGLGVPPLATYLALLVGGFALVAALYRGAATAARRYAPTLRSRTELERRFAVALLPIVVGYHLAHFLGFFLSLSPRVASALLNPLSPVRAPVVVLPDWFGALDVGFVLGGHLLAIWVAHAVAFDLFPSRLQTIRSQYGVTAVMVVYTMVSLWIVTASGVTPPYL